VARSSELPAKPITHRRPLTPAPAWAALLAAWLGLIVLVASIILIFLPGSQHPKEELEHLKPYSFADRYLPVPLYGIVVALFVGIVVLRQMRDLPRPLADGYVAQRVQAWVGIVLSLIATAVIYTWVGIHGPR
jgi:hypothetical protein